MANAAASAIRIKSSRAPRTAPPYRAISPARTKWPGASGQGGPGAPGQGKPGAPSRGELGAPGQANPAARRPGRWIAPVFLVAGGGLERVGRQVFGAPGVPGPLPAAEREQPVDQGGGEAPDQHAVQ